jgi:glucose-1-phosphate adenylyltransferase
VAGVRVPIKQAGQSGVIEQGDGTQIRSFKEKPSDPAPLPDDPEQAFASMGNYVFTADTLAAAVEADADNEDSDHDVGGDVIPMLVDQGVAHVHDFSTNQVPGESERDHGYWRDVGTLDTYYESHMDLVSAHPVFNLYNHEWPIYTSGPPLPPAKFVFEGEEGTGQVLNSMVCSGAIISGATVRGSVISPGVEIHRNACVEQSVLMHDVVVGPGAVIRNTIIDKNVQVPPGREIGVDVDADREQFTVSDNGIVVIGKDEKVPPDTKEKG